MIGKPDIKNTMSSIYNTNKNKKASREFVKSNTYV